MQRNFEMIDDSMAPKVVQGAVIKTRRVKPKSGDGVVAKVNGALLFRKFSRLNGKMVLSPLNPAYQTHHFSGEEWKSVEILGVMVAVETPARAFSTEEACSC